MAHQQQAYFCASVREAFPQYFSGVFVLDIGSLDVNGNNQYLFDYNCVYIGVDVAVGRNVDIITPAHLLSLPDATFDVIISTECLEHDRFYIETLRNIERLLKPGGLFLMTCATVGRPEHGTLRTTPQDAPLLQQINDRWANYYKNLTESDIRSAFDVDAIFSEYHFSVCNETYDLYFYGLKRGRYEKRRDVSWLLDSSPKYIKFENMRGELEAMQVDNVKLRGELEAMQVDNVKLRGELEAMQVDNVKLRGELEAMQVDNVKLRGELEAMQVDNVKLRGELEALLNSKSWRITHSLRIVATRVKLIPSLASRIRNALRYLLRGDFDGLVTRIKSFQNERLFENLLSGRSTRVWCVLATPHTLFIANLIAMRLKNHGWVVEIRTAVPDDFVHDMYIVLCPQMFKKLPPGERRISFQLEQSISSRWFKKDYIDALGNSLAVFDYALKNIEFLAVNGIAYPHVFYVPIGAYQNYMPQLTQTSKKYDILFYGDSASSPRRRKLLDIIRQKFKLRECSEVFADEMAAEIRAAHVVLNIHYYENALLEMPRIQECLSLGVPVVSESAQNQDEYPEIDGAVTFFEQGNEVDMVAAVETALRAAVDRKKVDVAVERGFERFAFMFDRALVALGFLPIEKLADDKLPLPGDASKIVLSMPETIQRRRMYEENKPIGYVIFDGLRARPGWIGCGISYASLAKHALRHGIKRLTVLEDDVLLSDDFELKMRSVNAYLDTQAGAWDVFAGVVAVLHEDTKIVKCENFDGMTFLTLNKMTSMVCNVYSERGMHLLATWDHTNRDDQTNTIDKHLERQPDLRVVVALPFIVGHREDVCSTLWGFQNTTYSALIEKSEKKLFSMLETHV